MIIVCSYFSFISYDMMYISVRNKCKYYDNHKNIGPHRLSTEVFSRLMQSVFTKALEFFEIYVLKSKRHKNK